MSEIEQSIDITNVPEVRRLIEEIVQHDEPQPLRVDGEDVAVVSPAKHPRRPRAGKPTSEDDPLWNIVGIAESNGPGGVAENTDWYLAQAYLPDEG